MSTISSGDARSIEAVRGLRRSVSRGSNINALPSGEPRPNLPDASRESQDNLEQDDETFFLCVFDAGVRGGIAQCASCGGREFTPRMIRSVWVSGGIGGFRANIVNDGATASAWNFGNSTNFQYRASLEAGMANGSSFGIAGSWARVPFQYSSSPIVVPPAGGGDAMLELQSESRHDDSRRDLSQWSGLGFHQLVELDGGVVAYRNLKQESDGARLAPVVATSIRCSLWGTGSVMDSAIARTSISFPLIPSPSTSEREIRTA